MSDHATDTSNPDSKLNCAAFNNTGRYH